MDSADIAVLILRAWIGGVMFAHGFNHGRNLKGTASYFESKGFSRSDLLAPASTYGEIAIGIGLVLGLLTPVAAAGLITTMTVAYGSVHRFAGFFVFKRPDEGWEYVATLAVAALVLATLGSGRISLDAVIGLDLRSWTGFLIALAGVAAGVAQLALLWRKPSAPTVE
ncbi:MAG: DoxX family protein [Actinobacteria bacterium]|nr:DoxX family protein [Actinomycetota bacterium]